MDSLPTSELRFFRADGKPIPAPAEWTPCLIELPAGEDEWEEARAWRRGEQLSVSRRRVGETVRTVARWPRAGAGHYPIRWRAGDRSGGRRVTVQPAKLSRASYAALLEDLETRLPVSIALHLQSLGALAGVELRPPSESTVDQEIYRLQRAVEGTDDRPGLARVLQDLAPDHHRVLATEERWVRAERARRPIAPRLAAAVARPGNLDRFEPGAGRQESDLAGAWLPRRIADARVEHTADLYENRLIKAYWKEVDLRLRRLLAVLSPSTDGRRELVSSLAGDLRRARAAARFLDTVGELSEPPSRVTMVLLRRPAYRAAFTGYQELHRATYVRHDDPGLDAPLRNLPALYQTWCTLKVLDRLLAVASAAGWTLRSQRLFQSVRRTVFLRVLRDGHSALELQRDGGRTVLRAIPECRYGKSGPLRSMSFTQIPDLAIELWKDGEPVRVWLFDPKYKLWSEDTADGAFTGEPRKDDIDKMHAYRDAIRNGAGERIVESAAILYPGRSVELGGGVAAVRAMPGDGVDVDMGMLQGFP